MESLWRVVLQWVPFLVLIGFWIFFMFSMGRSKAVKRQRELVERSFQHMDRIETLLERIAITIEKRPTV